MMKHALIGVVLGLLVQLVGSSGRQIPKVAVKDIKKHVGREVTTYGRVVTYDCENASGSLVLDLDSPWTRRGGVSIELPRQHWPDSLGRGLSNQYLFANVCVRGMVKKAGSRYRLMVDRLDAIDVTGRPGGSVPAFAPDAVQSCAEGLVAPVLLQEVKPTYTERAMRARQEGTVYLEAVVLPDGSVGDIRTMSGIEPDYGLDTRAVLAVKEWQFRAATLGGAAVPVVVLVQLAFTLR
jgi:TonB family protein